MKRRNRSLSGALIAVFALPVFMGLLACIPTFPVPVGDPEKSTIDPYVSGIWLAEDEEAFWVFEPYDKRTWLFWAFALEDDDDFCAEKFASGMPQANEQSDDENEVSVYEEVMAELASYGTECFEVDRMPGAIKVWRTKLGGEWFMTWASLGVFNAETGFEEDEWWVFRIDKSIPGHLKLWFINTSHEAWDVFEDIEEDDITRRAVEKIIRRNADDEAFYTDDEALHFYRVLPEHLDLLADFLDEDPLG